MELDPALTTVAATDIELTDHERIPPIPVSKLLVMANDNDLAWPIIAFPDGWHASF